MKKLIAFLCCFCSVCAFAQPRLTLQEAISRALSYSYDIRISRAAADIAAAGNTPGYAGMLPNIYGSGTLSTSRFNTTQVLSSGDRIERKGAKTTVEQGAINLQWTLFDGGRMFIQKRRLGELEKVGEFDFRNQIQTTVSQVIQAYAQVFQQVREAIAIDTGIQLAKVRMDISQAQFEAGVSAKTDYLQARVDYDARRSDSLTQISEAVTAQASLNMLMGEDADRNWTFDDTLFSDLALLPKQKDQLFLTNYELQSFRATARASKLNADVQKGALLPTLALNSYYNFGRTQSDVGFALLNATTGPYGALNLTVPIFNGGILRSNVKIASLQAFADQLNYERQTTEIGRQYRVAWSNYQLSVAAFKLEEDNIKYARENADIQNARFKAGISTTIETRQAENDYISALFRLYTAVTNLKINETIVLQLENRLVQN